MNLEEKWEWRGRKLACRVRVETGNPAGDDLRARFVELAGKDLEEMGKIFDTLDSLKNTKRKQEVEKKGVHIDHKADKKFNEILQRKHILGATQLAMDKIDEKELAQATTVTQKNLKKRFARLPVGPPPRVLLEIQRERAKPPTVVESEDMLAKRVKLEKKLEKQRIKRMQAMKATESEVADMQDTAKLTKDSLKSTFKIQGQPDLFSTHGDYMKSMLYMSRMKGNLEKSQRMKAAEATLLLLEGPKDAFTEEKKSEENQEENPADEGDDSQSQGSNIAGTDASAKLYCAVSLCNWSRNSANASRLAQEGGVRAIMQLIGESSAKIRRFCAAAFRFMSEDPILSISMIEEGAVSAIADVVKLPVDEFSATNLAVALVNLTRINGREATLVEGSMVLCLHQLVINCPDLAPLCARGLYNLTCVDGMYPLMERLIRTIISISSNSSSSVKHICAAALCNVSDLKLMRPRLIEEGIIAVLSAVARHSPTRTRRVCAVILQNLSATKSCRVEMVVRSSVHVAHSLSSDKDPIILRCVGLTLARLSTEPANAHRIVQEYGVAALINIAMKFSSVPGISQPVSTALQLLSQHPSIRTAIVSEGCVTSIAQLLQGSHDSFTQQNSLFALANLLTEPENHLPIVQQGLILTLVQIAASSDDTLRDLCALAFFNMSCSDESHKHIVNAGAIDSLIKLSKLNQTATKQRCAAALCNVSAYEPGMARMVSDGIIPALVDLLSEADSLTIHYSCAALCRLCTSQENTEIINNCGGVPRLVEGTLRGDNTTKQFCGAVLSALSYYDSCKSPLCDFGAIAALKSLASLNDDISHQRCLVAFANISCEPTVRTRMVQEGVVSVTASLIGNSYQEKNYICCAKALCNLACAEETRLEVAKQGGVHALLMISMVHSVDRQTKLLCVLALCNLLDANTVEFMLEEGISTSVANLAKIGDERILNLCAKIFNYLTRFQSGMEKMAERTSLTYSAISNMIDAENQETKMLGSRTIANLVLCQNKTVSKVLIEGGAFEPLIKGCVQDNLSAAFQCIAAIFSACSNPSFLFKLGQLNAPKTLLEVANSGVHREKAVYVLIAKTLAMLAIDVGSRPSLCHDSVVVSLLQYVDRNTDVECGRWISIALQNVVLGLKDNALLIDHGQNMLATLQKLHLLGDNTGVISAASVETVRILLQSGNHEAYIHKFACLDIAQILLKGLHESGKFDKKDTMYSVAVVVYLLARYSNGTRQDMCLTEVREIVVLLLEQVKCDDLSIAILFQFYHDTKCRASFSDVRIALGMRNVLKRNPTPDTLYNTISAFWALSKLASSRVYLEDPVGLNQYASDLSRTENQKLKANVTRLIKNLQSDANEAIEEGAVAALIAVSLEGKAQRQVAGNEMRIPDILPLNITTSLNCGVEEFDSVPFLFHVEKEVLPGGAAGKGPGLPEPPAMNMNSNTYSQFRVDELDGSEVEGKAKMSFAKMQVPNEMKTQHMLQNEDFNIKEDDTTLAESASVAGGIGLEGSLNEEESVFVAQAAEDVSKTAAGQEPSVSESTREEAASKGMESNQTKSPQKGDKTAQIAGDQKKKSNQGATGGTTGSKPNTPVSKKAQPKNTQTTEVEKANKEMGAKAAQLGLYK